VLLGFLERLVSGTIGIERDDTGAIFVDRSPRLFPYILEFLRLDYPNRFISPNSQEQINDLILEAEFYGVLW
jgi:hypothetical protein